MSFTSKSILQIWIFRNDKRNYFLFLHELMRQILKIMTYYIQNKLCLNHLFLIQVSNLVNGVDSPWIFILF